MPLFITSKVSDQLMVVEEEDKQPVAFSHQELAKRLEDKKYKDGTLVTKVSVLEKYTVVTKTDLEKEKTNGDSK